MQHQAQPNYQFDKMNTDYCKFIIISHARSGSNLLLNALNSHPNIIAEHEIFAAHNRNIGENFQPTLDNLFRKRPESAKAVGCKIFYYHLNQDEWRQISEIPELKVIHLKRKNALSMIVSMKVAFKTDQWGIASEAERIDAAQKQVHLDYDFLRQRFEQIELWEKNMPKLFDRSPIQNVFYQDLVGQYQQTVESLFSFLDLPQISLEMKIQHKKQNPEPLNQLIYNYDELKEKFADTPWASYFNC